MSAIFENQLNKVSTNGSAPHSRTPAIPTDLATYQSLLTDHGRLVLEKRYLRKGPDGKPVENIPEMFWRVASYVAQGDAEHGGDVEATARRFFHLMASLQFLPNSPTFTGAGTPLGQLSACYVLPIEDDMGKRNGGIFDTLKDAVLIQQTGGGNGFAFSRLRPRGALVKTSMGTATGPVGFLRVYDKAFGEVAQGGSRRGANMGVLRVDHPDIREFIHCKEKEGDIANFNISVGMTHKFLEAVEKREMFNLVFDGKVYDRVDAYELFQEIAQCAHKNGEPGVIFLDTANEANPVPDLYVIEASNPCGEQMLGPYESCCLGSVNLALFCSDDGEVDWDGLAEAIHTAVHFLDNVVSVNTYVAAVPELREAAHKARRIGLGFMGLADVLYKMGMRYGSRDALGFAGEIAEFFRYHAMRASIELAKKRGAFPAIKGSIYDPEKLSQFWVPMRRARAKVLNDRDSALDWRALVPVYYEEWEQLAEDIKAHGIRNACQTTVAPTGTLSTVSGVEGYGCEPVFALAYTRWVQDGDTRLPLAYMSPLFEKALVEAGIDEATRQRIGEQVALTGSCQGVPGVPREVQRVFVVSGDVTIEEHVRMQAAIQAFKSNAVSKTINGPKDATPDDVANAYMLAWKLGCKGITVYITGSREQVVLETKQTQVAKQGEVSDKSHPQEGDAIKPRPPILSGKSRKITTPLGDAYITLNTTEDGEPFEMFATVGKAGSDTFAISEAMGRLISLILRLPSNLTPSQRLQEVCKQLDGIGGSRHVGYGPHRVKSLPDGLSQALRSLVNTQSAITPAPLPIDDSTMRGGDLCPSCGQATLVNEEGCRKCYSCAYSEC